MPAVKFGPEPAAGLGGCPGCPQLWGLSGWMPPGWVTRCQCHLVAAASGSPCHGHLLLPLGTLGSPGPQQPGLSLQDPQLQAGWCPLGICGSRLDGVPLGPMAPGWLVSPWDSRLWVSLMSSASQNGFASAAGGRVSRLIRCSSQSSEIPCQSRWGSGLGPCAAAPGADDFWVTLVWFVLTARRCTQVHREKSWGSTGFG